MRIVFASTPDQEAKIIELVNRFYQEIFPLYYSDLDIQKFEQSHVLNIDRAQRDGTLKESYYVIASLQTLIFILEEREYSINHHALFDRNAETLREFGLHFPFSYDEFFAARDLKNTMFSIYAKPANQMLI